jgi:hypothetical protein
MRFLACIAKVESRFLFKPVWRMFGSRVATDSERRGEARKTEMCGGD